MFPPIPRICVWVCFFFLAFVFGDGGWSAWAETSHGPGGVKVNRYPNMDAPGNDAKWVRGIESFEQCESLCSAESSCSGYTYNFKQSACFQKSAMGPLAPPSVSHNHWHCGGLAAVMSSAAILRQRLFELLFDAQGMAGARDQNSRSTHRQFL